MTQSLVIFDLDGTLLDTLLDITQAVNWTLEQLQYPPLTPTQVKQHIGQGASHLLSGCLQDVGDQQALHLPQARALFFPYYTEHIADHTRPFPGVVAMLAALQKQGFWMAICSNKPYAMTEQLLHKLELRSFFRMVMGGDSLPKKKPDPAPLLHIIESCGCSLQQTIMVGDMEIDIQAGRQAGVKTLGISHDGKNKEQLWQAGADLVVSTIPEVLHALSGG